ncbi:MAG: hypothetical protein OCD76_15630 [Reichenbachiella sp.]
MTTVLLGIGLVGIFFIFMSVRLIFLKDGQFKGTCASQNPFLNKTGEPCGYCGKTVDTGDACGNPDNEVDKVLNKFN